MSTRKKPLQPMFDGPFGLYVLTFSDKRQREADDQIRRLGEEQRRQCVSA